MNKKAKTLAVLFVAISFATSIMLAGCGSGDSTAESPSDSTTASSENTAADSKDSDGKGTDTKEDEKADANAETTAGWEEFLDEYESWVDSYVAFAEKYAENPTDTSLLADYATLTSEMSDWASKASDIEKSLTPEEAAAYSKRLTDITAKVSDASMKLMAAIS